MSQSSCAGPALRHRPQRRATCCPHQTLPLLRKPLCHPGSSFWNHTQAMKALNRPLCKYARPGLCQRAATARPTPPLKKQIKGDCTAESTPLRTVLRRAQHELFICMPTARPQLSSSLGRSGVWPPHVRCGTGVRHEAGQRAWGQSQHMPGTSQARPAPGSAPTRPPCPARHAHAPALSRPPAGADRTRAAAPAASRMPRYHPQKQYPTRPRRSMTRWRSSRWRAPRPEQP